MRYRILFLIILGFSSTGFSQPPLKSFQHMIEKTNHLLECYDHLHPLDEYTLLSELPLKDAERNKIVEYLSSDSLLMNQRDSVETIYLIEYFQGEVLLALKEMLDNHGRMILLKKIKDDYLGSSLLSVAYSDDQKLFNISLDEKTGGTYRSRVSMMYYTEAEKRGQLNTEITYDVFTGDGFNSIHNIETKEGTKYVLTGSVRGCTTCFETSVILVKFNGETFVLDFEYSVVSRDYDNGVYYDVENNTIEIAYVTDDLTTHCDCISEASFELENEEEEEATQISCACKLEFDGLNFELVKASWEKLKD